VRLWKKCCDDLHAAIERKPRRDDAAQELVSLFGAQHLPG
jgi:hypothetical protein